MIGRRLDDLIRSGRRMAVITALLVLAFGILAADPEQSYADDYPGTVYFNLSDDGIPVVSDVTEEAMMRVPVSLQDVADVDLEDWGYGEYAYQEYGGNGEADPGRPTVLKLFLYMHDLYKDDPRNNITVTQGPLSAYMTEFWGHDENLNYYVNGAYPLYYEGWGATCDGIALEDGDRVDVMMFTNWGFYSDPLAGFNFFADSGSEPEDGAIVDSYEAKVGEPLDVQVIRGYGNLNIGGSTVYQQADDLPLHINGPDTGIDIDSECETVLENGKAQLTFDKPGIYYIWVEGGPGQDVDGIVQSAAAAMVTVKEPSHVHKLTRHGKKEASCDKEGSIEYWSCADCGKLFADEEGQREITEKDIVLPADPGAHQWDKGKVTKTATPNRTGVKTFTCTVCGATKTTTIAKTADILVAKGIATGATGVNLSWNKIVGADKYVIYFGRCDGKTKFKRVKTVDSKTLSWKKTGLAKNTNYKFKVVALKSGKTLRTSREGHFVSGNFNGKATNPKALTLNRSSLTLKKGKSATITGKVTKVRTSKKLMTNHTPILRYTSNDKSVATVTAKGRITAKKAGVARIYVQTINGMWKSVLVTVK